MIFEFFGDILHTTEPHKEFSHHNIITNYFDLILIKWN